MIPSYDLKTLYVARDLGNSLQAIDPTTGRPSGRRIHVPDPCNMYFTPDGRYAITVAELLKRLDFRDAHTMALVRSVPLQDRSTKRPGCLEPPQRKRCDADRHRKTKALLTANPA